MKTTLLLSIVFAAVLIVPPTFAQETTASPATASAPVASGQPSQAEMMKQMMEMAKLNENHKMLADMVGTWNYTVTMWMNPDPNAKPETSKGTSVTNSMMNGRFFVTNVTGKMEMPGADGKMKNVTFKGMGIDGYDNAKQKFVGSWVDSMGTGIMMSEGTYDAATKTLTYNAEYTMAPGMVQKIREVVKITDKDHHTFEWYENRGGEEKKTMEIVYTRKK
jgi:hypothetical protein